MVYDVSNLRAVMAGSGKPYDVLTDLRKQLIRALHDEYSLADIQDMFQISENELLAELNLLVEASLVRPAGATFQPDFFVTDVEETQNVVEHAQLIGKKLFDQLNEDWDGLLEAFQHLKIARDYSLRDLGMQLVGAIILDVGLLEYLARDASLLPPAPHRPAPHTPDAHYYFWMIEGEPEAIGKYGQTTMGLPYDGWIFFTFGQYVVGQQYNETRHAFQQEVVQSAESLSSAEELAGQHRLPILSASDVAGWSPVVREACEHLLAVYRDNDSSLRSLHMTLNASQYSAHSFAEFFCWFDHVAYAAAIDLLEQANMIAIPESRFGAALWEGDMGPTFFGPPDK